MTAESFKQDGYSTVSPDLIVAGAQRGIDFLKQTFGARQLRRYDMADGSIMHAEVRVGDEDPDRRGGVKDSAGNTWWIATQVAKP